MSAQAPRDRYVSIGGINTRYWMEGENGPNVLLIHGLGGSVENWAQNIGPLSRHYRVYALDLRGFGLTDKKPLIDSMYDLVRFIDDFMRTMRIDKAALIANSMGGGLALQFAIDYSEKVTKLVLVDTAGMGREVSAGLKLMQIPLLGELLARPGRRGVDGVWKTIVYDPSMITEDLVALTGRLLSLPGARRALLKTLRTSVNFLGQRDKLTKPMLAKIGTIIARVLIIWGRQDHVLPVAHAYKCHACLPGSELHIFDRCGHVPQLEHPDEFNRVTLEFLAGRTAPVAIM